MAEQGLDLPYKDTGTTQQDKQQFNVVAPQTIFTTTTILANAGSSVYVDGLLQDFGVTRAGQIFTFAVAVAPGSIVTITGSFL